MIVNLAPSQKTLRRRRSDKILKSLSKKWVNLRLKEDARNPRLFKKRKLKMKLLLLQTQLSRIKVGKKSKRMRLRPAKILKTVMIFRMKKINEQRLSLSQKFVIKNANKKDQIPKRLKLSPERISRSLNQKSQIIMWLLKNSLKMRRQRRAIRIIDESLWRRRKLWFKRLRRKLKKFMMHLQ